MWGILRKWGNYGFDEGESVRYLIKEGKIYEAYFAFGMGLHTLQDATSPSHHGFQIWSSHNSILGNGHPEIESVHSHISKEMSYPGQDSNLQKITNYYLDWFESDSTTLPSQNLFDNIKSD
jgi:hypothetical protein